MSNTMIIPTANRKETEAIIKQAARKVFLQKGLAGARLQEIADEAGIGRTSLHYYYRNKEKLFNAVFSDNFLEIKRRIPYQQEEDLPLEDILIQFTKEYFSNAIKNPELDLFLLNEFCARPESMLNLIKGHEVTQFILQAFEKSIQKGKLKGNAQQHFITFISVTFFPFAAKNMIQQMLQCSEEDYLQYMQSREDYIVGFIEQYFNTQIKK
ncbi:MAG: TetR/AcrR family transcriptional regulator [Chitinophagales bacterium]|nr:TetR/AcrR family transcriptional regulator [Chitinophagales bacterium]